MKIFIQGRKDGYNVLYPKPTPTEFFQFASDIQRIDAQNLSHYYGKSFYSIAFNGSGCIFSEFIIGYDVQRCNLGNIGISVFIPNTQKLAGVDVRTLLDDLVNIYRTDYGPDFYINNNKQEDWSRFTLFVNNYEAKLHPISDDDAESMQSGTQDAAFVYYSTNEELQNYFDLPYQDEYSEYKQVFFVESSLQGKSENPLNVLRHNSASNLTGEVGLEKYKLEYVHKYADGINIEVNVGIKKRNCGEWISCGKDEMTIIYSKNYYKNKIVTGKLREIDKRFLQINDMDRIVTIHHFRELDPETKKILFDIKDEAGNIIENACVSWQKGYGSKNTTSNEIIFRGEEIGNNWKIHIEAGDKYKPQEMDITPQKELCILITLKAQKIVEFHIIDKENVNYNSTSEIGIPIEQHNKIYFYGSDIKKTWHICIITNNLVEYTQIVPINVNRPIVVNLNGKIYYLGIDGSKGKRSYHGLPIYGYAYNNKYSGFKCYPKFGYKFTAWKNKEQPYQNYDGYYEAVFKELWYHKYRKSLIIVGSVIALIVIIYFALFRPTPPKQTITVQQITDYVEGDSLLLDRLNDYKKEWEDQGSNFITKSGGGPFGGNETVDSTKWKSGWQSAYESIERAITKRTLLANNNFEELKNQRYSSAQQKFKDAINKIDSINSVEVEKRLGNISALTLTQIADSINSILTSKESVKTEQMQEGKKEEKKAELKKESQQPIKPAEQPISQEQKPAVPLDSTDMTSIIIQYIKGSELKKATLESQKKQTRNSDLKKSIELALKFWTIDGSNNNSYFSFQQELDTDNNLQNSELKSVVDALCGKKNPKYVIELPKSDQNKKLNELKDKLQ